VQADLFGRWIDLVSNISAKVCLLSMSAELARKHTLGDRHMSLFFFISLPATGVVVVFVAVLSIAGPGDLVVDQLMLHTTNKAKQTKSIVSFFKTLAQLPESIRGMQQLFQTLTNTRRLKTTTNEVAL